MSKYNVTVTVRYEAVVSLPSGLSDEEITGIIYEKPSVWEWESETIDSDWEEIKEVRDV